MKKGSKKGWRKLLPQALLLTVMIVVGTVGTGVAHADILVWHSVHMKPGETHDISHAKANTTIYIEEAGNYTLKGSSRNVRVLIESRDTNVYLADGLDINCSSTSYTGSRTAAIWVMDNGGTVKLISKKNANVRLEGYMCPAIRKEGTKTKLIFETEDTDHPGTINANSGSRILADTMEPAAIGSIEYDTGNMTFNSGNVIAKIRGTNWGGAAIGGGAGYNASDITVNGGRVEAYGSENGAGIGAGTRGTFAGFYVNGGDVHAENGAGSDYLQGGAAIGSGGVYLADFPGPTITLKAASTIGARDFYIKGGKVTAKSNGAGAAIGGGTGMGCKNINIEGGVVDATVDSRKASHDCYGAAIGGGPGVRINAEINISGGRITANGGPQSPGIGSQDAEKTYDGHQKDPDQGVYRISGGTIHVQGGEGARGDIGTRESKTVITGGNLLALSHAGQVVNEGEEEVHRVEIGFDKTKGDRDAISDLIFKPDDYANVR